MGDCTYFLKAEFHDERTAKRVAIKLNKFFAEAKDAYKYYQSKRNEKTWEEFSTKFPKIWEYVQLLPDFNKNSSNFSILSGKLDFGQENEETLVQKNEISWYDSSVWHFSDWTYLCTYIQKNFGAVKVVWDTEENGCGCLDNLQLHDWETIVKDLLKSEELLPLLIGINHDLDLMIRSRLSK